MNNQEFEQYYQEKKRAYLKFYRPIAFSLFGLIIYFFIIRALIANRQLSALLLFPVFVFVAYFFAKNFERKRILDKEMVDLKRERKNRR